MATIITIASSKGGAGKTTVARLLLGHAAHRGLRAVAVDADLNHSLAEWCERISRDKIPAHPETDETKILDTVDALQDGADVLVIDTAGASNQSTIFAIGAADLVLVPCKLSSSDLAEAIKTMRLVASAAQMSRREIPARLLLTGFKPRTSIASHVETEVLASGIPMLRTRLVDLVAYEEMTFNGVVPVLGSAGVQAASMFDEAMEICGVRVTQQPMKLAS